MATKKITFDADSGVPYGANLPIYGGANFNANYDVVNTSNTAFDFTGWTGSAQMVKSVGVGATNIAAATFTVGFTSAYDGKFICSMTAAATTAHYLSEGRYVYNILVSSGQTTYNIINGNVLVYAGITSAPS